nr:solute carrier family 22 member 8-like [Penaeus vannamei]
METGREDEKREVNVTALLKTPVLRPPLPRPLPSMWSSAGWSSSSPTTPTCRNTEHIGPNVFAHLHPRRLRGAPADFLTMVAVEKLGRRHTTGVDAVLGGALCLGVAAVPPDNTHVILALAIAGRFLITMSINVGQQYPIEVLPTVARGSGSGAIHTLGYGAAFVSPYVVYLSKFGHFLPYTILGVVTVVGGLVCVLLPETLDQKLPDSLEDGEAFFAGQGCCYNPCARVISPYKLEKSGGITQPYLTIYLNTYFLCLYP